MVEVQSDLTTLEYFLIMRDHSPISFDFRWNIKLTPELNSQTQNILTEILIQSRWQSLTSLEHFTVIYNLYVFGINHIFLKN